MSAPLSIARLDAQDPALSARWDAFVLAHPQATFFHRSGWMRVIQRVFGHPCYFLFAERDGQIEGVLPLAEAAGAADPSHPLGPRRSLRFGHPRTAPPPP